MFAEHQGLQLSDPLSRAGARVELDKPILGGLFAYTAGELGMAKTSSGWTPDVQVHAGLGLTF